jgi:hypothetical protein
MTTDHRREATRLLATIGVDAARSSGGDWTVTMRAEDFFALAKKEWKP